MEICEIGEITGKSSEITARGSPLLPSTLFYAGWNPPEGGKGRAAVKQEIKVKLEINSGLEALSNLSRSDG